MKISLLLNLLVWFELVNIVYCACGPPFVFPGIHTFGPQCRYRCNCLNNEQCDATSGECPTGCRIGWMGPACQYRNLVAAVGNITMNPAGPNPEYVTDGNRATCSKTGGGPAQRSLRIDMASPMYIVGLVIVIPENDINVFGGFKIEIGNSTTEFELCFYDYQKSVTLNTVEVNCINPSVGRYVQVSLAEDKVANLTVCEIEIYGGRLISFNQPTAMESVYSSDAPWNGFYAVDGQAYIPGQNTKSTRTCASSDVNYKHPRDRWWSVDLKHSFSIQTVSFFGRQDNTNLLYQYEGYYITLSENGTAFILVANDSPSHNVTDYNPKLHDLDWPRNSQYVRVNLDNGQILNICELEVFAECPYGLCGWDCNETCMCTSQTAGAHKIMGTCPHGCAADWSGQNGKCYRNCSIDKWGSACDKVCGNCEAADVCSVTDGRCPGNCKPGYQPPFCSQDCFDGNYGTNCWFNCGNCLANSSCNRYNGSCGDGCKIGYKMPLCTDACDKGFYGKNCSMTCGNCRLDNDICNHVNGACPGQCAAGYQGPKCDDVCNSTFFGMDCVEKCGHCKNGTCDHVNGTCLTGCSTGWETPYCNETCKFGSYGDNCSLKCGPCWNTSVCHHINGSCPYGCAAGFKGTGCETSCAEGTYGRNCQDHCGSCANITDCDRVTGKCDECLPGWIGSHCNESCDDNRYGQNCDSVCGNCADGDICNKTSGICPGSCSEGFFGNTCNTVCDHGKYGRNCNQTCGYCNTASDCDKMTGNCSNGCSPGYRGHLCESSCPDGLYGHDCIQSCGKCKDGANCDKISGSCTECEPGYQPGLCIIQQQEQKDQSGDILTGAVIGSVVVVVLVGPAVVVVVVFLKRRSARKLSEYDQRGIRFPETVTDNNAFEPDGEEVQTSQDSAKTDEDYYNFSSKAYENSTTFIVVTQLRSVCRNAMKDPKSIFAEFQTIPYGLLKNASEASRRGYAKKNRYKDMFPYDENRVCLPEIPGDPISTYINASYVDGYDRPKKYIAAQGALKTTVNDVWRMVWSENVAIIVMLTNCVEEGKQKCVRYWPDEGTVRYRHIEVTLVTTEVYADFIIRRLHITQDDEDEMQSVVQFHYTAWPDKDVPDTALSIVQFWRKVREHASTSTHIERSPWLVHCSAGIGRTGTFIAADILFDQGKHEGRIAIKDCVVNLRNQRLKMVQTKEQYLLLHDILAEILDSIGVVYSNDEFTRIYQTLSAEKATNKQKLYAEYQRICKHTEEIEEAHEEGGIYFNTDSKQTRDAEKLENIRKSRDTNILPDDRDRPRLGIVVEGCNDFINAVYIPTYRYKDRLILTQYPLKETVVDFIRMIWEYNITEIVLLEYPALEDGKYWPHALCCETVGPFVVETINEQSHDTHILRTLRMKMVANKQQKSVRQYQFKSWLKDKNIPKDTSSILNLISSIENNRENAVPVVVQCLDGCKRSGVFYTIYSVLERMKLDREVGVAETVRMARVKRSQLIENFEQYKFCHEVIMEYLQRFDVYANIT